MSHLLYILTGTLLLLGWTVLAQALSMVVLTPHVVLLVIVHATMQRGAFHGLVALIFLGLLGGLLSGGPRGLYLLSLLPAVPLAWFARTRLQAEGSLLQAATVVPAVLVCEFILAAGVILFRTEVALMGAYVRVVPASALMTGLLGVIVIPVLARVGSNSARRRKLVE